MNTPPLSSLSLSLPGVVSWSRPRRIRGLTRYPAAYARDRAAWAAVVQHRVQAANGAWCPPIEARYRVLVEVTNGGKRDLDRVVTAVLDALQAGGVFPDDCRVDSVWAERAWQRGVPPMTRVEVRWQPTMRTKTKGR